MNRVYIVSDGTGGTAERNVKAALTQFGEVDVELERRPNIRSEEQVTGIVQEASRRGGIVVHTLVSNELREFMVRTGRLYNTETIDLLGPLLSRFSDHLEVTPAEKPGIFRELNEEYFRLIETMEFALRHDDGLHWDELDQAEIVLVGVSRTFKTPLSVYLAFKGWYVANVPIVLNREPPELLFELPPERVFGLKMNTRRLAALRSTREKYLHGATGEYADLDHVRQEAVYALKIFDRPPQWATVDVTSKPIEEIASEILALVPKERYTPQAEEP
jgi:hypothetical protein